MAKLSGGALVFYSAPKGSVKFDSPIPLYVSLNNNKKKTIHF